MHGKDRTGMSDIVPLDPVLKLAVTIRMSYTPYETVGDMGKGVRRIMTVTGGTFEIRAPPAIQTRRRPRHRIRAPSCR